MVEKLCIGLLVLCGAALVGLLGWLAFLAIDKWGCPRFDVSGVIYSREIEPAHTRYVLVGKIIVPQWVGTRWHVCVRVGGEFAWMAVKEGFYCKCERGRLCEVEATRGRFTSKLSLESITLK